MPRRQTDRLHAFRYSSIRARYFVTCCTQGRRAGLSATELCTYLLEQVSLSDRREDTQTLAFVSMPDHLHWLLALGDRLTLGQVVGRLKAKTRSRLASAGLGWQRDFFEHRLRPEDSTEDYARYMFLNPYRAGLISVEMAWPGWWCPEPELFRFTSLLSEHGGPPAKWIGEPIPCTLVQAD